MPILDEIRQHAVTKPDKTAVSIGSQARSYRELYEAAQTFTHNLARVPITRPHGFGLAAGGRLAAVSLGNHPDFPAAFVGGTHFPHACAVIDPNTSPDKIEDLLTRLSPDILVAEHCDAPAAAIGRRLGINVVVVEQEGTRGLDLATLAPTKDSTPEFERSSLSELSGTFLINFTSGTTSFPKAYSRSRQSWRTSLETGKAVFGLSENSSTMCPGALAHGLALYALVETLHSGATFHTVTAWDREEIGGALKENEVRRLVLVPTMITGIANSIHAAEPFKSVTSIVTAGSKLETKHIELIERFFPCAEVIEYYGASELGFVAVSTLGKHDRARTVDHVGEAFPGVEISIRSADGSILAENEIGTIFVQSPLISDGYLWGDDGLAFRTQPYGATVGDIGTLNSDGRLRVMGREGGMVLSGGHNIYPAEVESALRAMPDITEAVVLGLKDDYLGQRLVAIVSGGSVTGDEILAHCRLHLPRYKVPRALFKIESWPVTSSGKVARRQVETMLEDRSDKILPVPTTR